MGVFKENLIEFLIPISGTSKQKLIQILSFVTFGVDFELLLIKILHLKWSWGVIDLMYSAFSLEVEKNRKGSKVFCF